MNIISFKPIATEGLLRIIDNLKYCLILCVMKNGERPKGVFSIPIKRMYVTREVQCLCCCQKGKIDT